MADNLDVLFERAIDLAKAEIVEVNDGGRTVQFLVRQSDQVAQALEADLAAMRPTPDMIRGRASLVTLQSLIDHANRFKDDKSIAYADPDKLTILTVYDYHEQAGKPRWGRHRGVWSAPLSPEFKAWSGASTSPLNQLAFAAFVEDHIRDIGEPPADTGGTDKGEQKLVELASKMMLKYASAMKLIELSRGLAVKSATHVTGIVSLQSGEGELSWGEEHSDKAGGKLAVPGLFVLQIPIFDGGVVYRMPARLRYRLQDGRVVWWFDIWQMDLAKRDAFMDAVNDFKAGASLPLMFGAPEGKE